MENLENRISSAKTFLNAEIVNIKTGNQASMPRQEIAYHLDTIFEIERTGLRHLNDLQEVKLNRVLTSVESLMTPISQN
jgi:hypothetical protein